MQPRLIDLQGALQAVIDFPGQTPHDQKKPSKNEKQVGQTFQKVHQKNPLPPTEPQKQVLKRKREEPVQGHNKRKKVESEQLIRCYPPLSQADTIIGGKGAHGQALSFEDKDIIEIFQRCQQGDRSIPKIHNKAVLLQQSTRGCTSACAEMFKADHNKPVDWKEMETTNLGTTKTMTRTLNDSGLKTLVKEKTPFKDLSHLLQKNGSAIIDVNSGCGGHVIILDKLSNGKAYIRDPYHGWAIALKVDALQKAVGNSTTVIQVQKPSK